MSLLLSPHDVVLARKFCEMVHDARRNNKEEIVLEVVEKFLEELRDEGKESRILAIQKQMKTCNKELSVKLGF